MKRQTRQMVSEQSRPHWYFRQCWEYYICVPDLFRSMWAVFLKRPQDAVYAYWHAGRPNISNLFMRSLVRRLELLLGFLPLPLEFL